MVAALEWINANIAEFGGDPENVTIFGQSGGGRKVLSLLTVPAAASLFHFVTLGAESMAMVLLVGGVLALLLALGKARFRAGLTQ